MTDIAPLPIPPALHPAPKRTLPPAFRGKNAMRLAEKLPQGVRDPGFEDLLQRIDGSPVLGGNRLEIFFDGKLAFPAMLETIRSAKREVLFEFFIVRNYETGRLFQEELVAAVKRGVTVRVLADSLGAPHRRNVSSEGRTHDVEMFQPATHPRSKSPNGGTRTNARRPPPAERLLGGHGVRKARSL